MTLEELFKRLPSPTTPADEPHDVKEIARTILRLRIQIKKVGRVAFLDEQRTLNSSLQSLADNCAEIEASQNRYGSAYDFACLLAEQFGEDTPTKEAVDANQGQSVWEGWFPTPYVPGGGTIRIVPGCTMGETREQILKELTEQILRLEKAQKRYDKANLQCELMKIALELDLLDEGIEEIPTTISIQKGQRANWQSRHQGREEWIAESFSQYRPKTTSDLSAIKQVMAAYAMQFRSEMHKDFPSKPKDEVSNVSYSHVWRVLVSFGLIDPK